MELENPNPNDFQYLLNTNKIGKWEVTVSKPTSDQIRYGVIGPISTSITDLDELKEGLEVSAGPGRSNDSFQITTLKRLKKKRTDQGSSDAQCVKIGFISDSNDLPEAVLALHSYYKVRPYVFHPLQCYRCQMMGHTALSCKGKVRCLLCSGPHPKEDCPNKGTFKCANCSGPHRANSPECKAYSTAQNIEKIRAKTNKTYMEARKEVIGKKQMSITNASRGSYRNALIGNESDSSSQTVYVDSSSQTELPSVEHTRDQFLEKLKVCLIEILNNILPDASQNTRKDQIITDALDKTFKHADTMDVAEQESNKRNRSRTNSRETQVNDKSTKTPTFDPNERSLSPTPKTQKKSSLFHYKESSHKSSKSSKTGKSHK